MSSQAVQHSWKAYEKYAWGFDELMPLNKSGINSFGGLGATIIDSLDTLHMMSMKAEFKRCAARIHVLTLCIRVALSCAFHNGGESNLHKYP